MLAMEITLKPFLTVDEVADLVRVSRDWVLKEIHRGRLGCHRIAGRVRIRPEQLYAWLRLTEKLPEGARSELTIAEKQGEWQLTADGWRWVPKAGAAGSPSGRG